jgi:hypothetical protein
MDLEVIYRVPADDLRRLSSGDYPAVGTAVANFNRDAEQVANSHGNAQDSVNLTYKALIRCSSTGPLGQRCEFRGPPEFADELSSSCPATDL